MVWVRLADDFTDHPKVVAAGPLAAWLFVCGLAYANRYLTDGFLPTAQVRRFADVEDPMALAAKLVESGLWEHGVGGFMIHDYHTYQPSSDDVKRERDATAKRQAEFRRRRAEAREQARNAVTNASLPYAVTNASPDPDPDPDPARPGPGPDPGLPTGDPESIGSVATDPPAAGAAKARKEAAPKDQARLLRSLSPEAREVLDWHRQCLGRKKLPDLTPASVQVLEAAVADLGLERLRESVRYMAGKIPPVPELSKAIAAARSKRTSDEAPPVIGAAHRTGLPKAVGGPKPGSLAARTPSERF